MSEHAELLKEARGLASRLDYMNTGAKLIPRNAATTIRTLADIVKQQDKAQAESLKGVREQVKKDNAELFNVLVEEIEQQDKTLAETVTACKACDEVIRRVISVLEGGTPLEPGSQGAYELEAAAYAARNAIKPEKEPPSTLPGLIEDTFAAHRTPGPLMTGEAKLAEPKGDEVTADEFKWACESARVPPTPSGYSGFRDRVTSIIGKRIQDLPFGNQPSASVELGRCLDDVLRVPLTNESMAVTSEQPAPLVEVEMRLIGTAGNEATWQALIGGMWFSAASCDDRTFYNSSELATVIAYRHGNAWLAALSQQLDVRLVAVWKDGE